MENNSLERSKSASSLLSPQPLQVFPKPRRSRLSLTPSPTNVLSTCTLSSPCSSNVPSSWSVASSYQTQHGGGLGGGGSMRPVSDTPRDTPSSRSTSPRPQLPCRRRLSVQVPVAPPIISDSSSNRRRCASGGEDELRKMMKASAVRTRSNSVHPNTFHQNDIPLDTFKLLGKKPSLSLSGKIRSRSCNYLLMCFQFGSPNESRHFTEKLAKNTLDYEDGIFQDASKPESDHKKGFEHCMKNATFSMSSPSIQEMRWSKEKHARSRSYVIRKSFKKLKKFARTYSRRHSVHDENLESFSSSCESSDCSVSKSSSTRRSGSEQGSGNYVQSALTKSFLGGNMFTASCSFNIWIWFKVS